MQRSNLQKPSQLFPGGEAIITAVNEYKKSQKLLNFIQTHHQFILLPHLAIPNLYLLHSAHIIRFFVLLLNNFDLFIDFLFSHSFLFFKLFDALGLHCLFWLNSELFGLLLVQFLYALVFILLLVQSNPFVLLDFLFRGLVGRLQRAEFLYFPVGV